MRQLLQNMRDGKTTVVDVPVPSVRSKTALVQTAVSLVSAGTERMVVEFAEMNLVEKAASRPDLVKQVLSKARREGVIPTIEAAFNKLDQPMALGYSSSGVILEVGEGLKGFKVGDRVACGGGGYAVHAEVAVVPQNLLVHLPDNVGFESAAFTTVGSVAMQGFRLASPQLGDRVCIIGLGLLGLMTAGVAHAAGCKVFGVDISAERVALARQFGAESVTRSSCEEAAIAFTGGRGFDSVLICADTASNDTVELAGVLARDRGVVVAIGAVGMDIPRKIYYEKELDFKISRSYGPGRYDSSYEEGGKDYPFGYVRWTEGRNMEAFVDLLSSGQLDVKPLISHRFNIEKAADAYELITGKQHQPFLGVLLTYPEQPQIQLEKRVAFPSVAITKPSTVTVNVLGAGNYANAVFLPAVKKSSNSVLRGIASASGLSASHAARRFGFQYASSSEEEVLKDPEANTLILLTRHNLHARQVLAALQAGKNVYCEKPLAIRSEELDEIEELLKKDSLPLLMVGFNRRFAPFSLKLAQFLSNRTEPLIIHYRVNAGFLPANHWLHDPNQGGGRIIGEGCHFIDYLTYLVGQSPIRVTAAGMPNENRYQQDNVVLTFGFPDGSVGTVTYLANGNKNYSKERVEVFCGGKIGILDDFRTLDLITENHHQRVVSRFNQDKGHQAAWKTFFSAILTSGPAPIPYDQLIGVSKAGFAAVQALDTEKEVKF